MDTCGSEQYCVRLAFSQHFEDPLYTVFSGVDTEAYWLIEVKNNVYTK